MNVPYGYSLCLLADCPKADSCLRHAAYLSSDEENIKVINPRMVGSMDRCSYYVRNEKVRYAKGFRKVMGLLTRNAYAEVVSALIGQFSQRTYYRIRKGDRLLSPDEQRIVRNIIARHGYTDVWEFDAYVEDYLW